MYQWIYMPPMFADMPLRDVYWRDQLMWGAQLERQPGAYDFSVIEAGLAEAGRRGGRFSFRIMGLCPGCGGTMTPSYVPLQANGAPAWNSEAFLSGYERLLSEIGRRYGSDPRLGTIDVGGYGMYGEWYCDSWQCGDKISFANAQRLVRAAVDAFPRKFVLLPFDDVMADELSRYSPRIGMRMDCVGGINVDLTTYAEDYKNVWRHAPVVGEWCNWESSTPAGGLQNVLALHMSSLAGGNYPREVELLSWEERQALKGVYAATGHRYRVTRASVDGVPTGGGAVSISTTWENLGVAPTYDDLIVHIRLVDEQGQMVNSTTGALDLRYVVDTPKTVTSTLSIPAGSRGPMRVMVVVVDAHGYLSPLTLDNADRQADGSYPVANFVVG